VGNYRPPSTFTSPSLCGAQLRQLFRYQLTQRSDIPFSTISQWHAHIEPQTMIEAAVGAKKLAWRKSNTSR
jgi:hypothetical protein